MKKRLFVVFALLVNISSWAQEIIRGDLEVQFKWRTGYSEYPINLNSQVEKEDSRRGTYNWYDGYLWSNNYKNRDGETISGVSLLYRGGSPYARSVRTTSALVPVQRAGLPVTFAIPIQYTLGSEARLSVAITINGTDHETTLFDFYPAKEISVTNGRSKITFLTHQISQPQKGNPLTIASGILYIRTYPALLKYGERMSFEFNSKTNHMDIGSGLLIGSLYKDLSNVESDPQLSPEQLAEIDSTHLSNLAAWRQKSKAKALNLRRTGTVNVDCSTNSELYDRGELRVQAYSGNPVKDFQFGVPSEKMSEMASAIIAQAGRKFKLFRYQHHRLPWKQQDPTLIDSMEMAYISKWLDAANANSEQLMLCFQISPIIKEYKNVSQMGVKALPVEGIPAYPWESVTQGYLTTLAYLKSQYPNFKIVQMPYEFDNISNSPSHRQAHYMLYKSLYRAVYKLNKTLKKDEQIEIAGLSINTPIDKWDFIESFLEYYSKDGDKSKRLDYLTWHGYLFPGTKPNHPRGINKTLNELLAKYSLPASMPVIIDECGLAEPSTIEDLSDLYGASRKESAMACFTASIHDWYLRERGNFIPISGGGWHFGLMSYGKQNVMSNYAKGALLRSKLLNRAITSVAAPLDEDGYGLYSFATVNDSKDSLSLLVWNLSPTIFYQDIETINYDNTQITLAGLPAKLRNRELTVRVQYFCEKDSKDIFSSSKCQTLPLTRGADRYEVDFTSEEADRINKISTLTYKVKSTDGLKLKLDVQEHSMYLITLSR